MYCVVCFIAIFHFALSVMCLLFHFIHCSCYALWESTDHVRISSLKNSSILGHIFIDYNSNSFVILLVLAITFVFFVNVVTFLTIQAEVSGNTAAQELTLEEQRAIEEEARKTGIQEAEAKAKEQRKNQPEAAVGNGGKDGAAAGPPGRDSGFCSEQDQKQKQQEQQNHEVIRDCSCID